MFLEVIPAEGLAATASMSFGIRRKGRFMTHERCTKISTKGIGALLPLLMIAACGGATKPGDATTGGPGEQSPAALCAKLDSALKTSWTEAVIGNDDKKPEGPYLTNYKYTCFEGANEGVKNSGPGNEQEASVVVKKDGATYIVTVDMTSNVNTGPNGSQNSGDGPWQCQCVSYQLNVNGPPTQVAVKQLTPFAAEAGKFGPGGPYANNDRPCNHPSVATVDGEHVVMVYGTDKRQNDDTETYAMVIDKDCNAVTAGEPVLLSHDRYASDVVNGQRDESAANNDPLRSDPEFEAILQARYDALCPNGQNQAPITGSPCNDPDFLGDENNNDDGGAELVCFPNGKCVAAYLKRGGRDEDNRFMVASFTVGGQGAITVHDNRTALYPGEIAREVITKVDADSLLFCAPKSNNRPSEYGIYCSQVHVSADGTLTPEEPTVLAPTTNQGKPNQVQLSKLGDRPVALVLTSVRPVGPKKRGTSKSEDHIFLFDADGKNPKEIASNFCPNAAKHGTIAGFKFLGKDTIGCLAGTISGSGLGSISAISEQDGQWKKINPFFLGVNLDAGWLSAMCGANPGTQGRNFMSLLTAENPGFGVEGGFQPDSENLLIYTGSGKAGGKKNSMIFGSLPTDIKGLTPEAASACVDLAGK